MVRKKVVSIVLVLCMMCTMVFTVYASEYEAYVKVSDELLQGVAYEKDNNVLLNNMYSAYNSRMHQRETE